MILFQNVISQLKAFLWLFLNYKKAWILILPSLNMVPFSLFLFSLVIYGFSQYQSVLEPETFFTGNRLVFTLLSAITLLVIVVFNALFLAMAYHKIFQQFSIGKIIGFVSFSVIPFVICKALNLFTGWQIFNYLQFITVFAFWNGLTVLFEISNSKKVQITTLAMLLFYLLFAFTNASVSGILSN